MSLVSAFRTVSPPLQQYPVGVSSSPSDKIQLPVVIDPTPPTASLAEFLKKPNDPQQSGRFLRQGSVVGQHSSGGGACRIIAPDINFGSVDSAHEDYVDVSATFTVTCANQVFLPSPMNVCVHFAPGSEGGTSGVMGGASSLPYELYSDAARTNPLETIALPLFNFPASGGSSTRQFTAYGRLLTGRGGVVEGRRVSALFTNTETVTYTWSYHPYQQGCAAHTPNYSVSVPVTVHVHGKDKQVQTPVDALA